MLLMDTGPVILCLIKIIHVYDVQDIWLIMIMPISGLNKIHIYYLLLFSEFKLSVLLCHNHGLIVLIEPQLLITFLNHQNID